MESEARDYSSCRDFYVGSRSSLLFTEKLVSDHFQFFDFLLRQYKLFLIDLFTSGKLFCKRMEKIYNYTTLRFLSSWEKHFSNHLRRNPHSNCKCCATIGDKIVETLYSNRVTSENKVIYPPSPFPPFKVGEGLFSIGSSNSGTTLHGGGKSYIIPPFWSQ